MIAAIKGIRSYDAELRTIESHIRDCLAKHRASLLRNFYRSKDAFCSCSIEPTTRAVDEPGFTYFLTSMELQTLPTLTDNERWKVTQACLYYTGDSVTPPNIGALGYVRRKARRALCD